MTTFLTALGQTLLGVLSACLVISLLFLICMVVIDLLKQHVAHREARLRQENFAYLAGIRAELERDEARAQRVWAIGGGSRGPKARV